MLKSRLIIAICVLLFSSAASAQWVQEPGGGYMMGAYGWAKTYEGLDLKHEAGASYKYEPTTGIGQLLQSQLKEVKLTKATGYGSQINLTSTSSLKARWIYIGSNGAVFPHISLEWNLKSQGNAYQNPTSRCAYGYGSIGGVIAREFKNMSGQQVIEDGTITLVGSYTQSPDSENESWREAHMKGEFGDNWITAKWMPNYENPDQSFGAWIVSRRLRLSNGNWESTGTINEVMTVLSYSKTAFAIVPSNGKLLTRARMSKAMDPRTNTNWTAETKLESGICNGGITGMDDSINDVWKGEVKVIPNIAIDPS
jgi:hypothetical protein